MLHTTYTVCIWFIWYMYAISPLCVSSVDQPIFMFSFPERFEFFFFFSQRILILHPQIFRIITGACVFNGMETPGWIWDFVIHSLTFLVKMSFFAMHRKISTVSHFYLLDVFFFKLLSSALFWMLVSGCQNGPGTREKPRGKARQTWGFSIRQFVKFFFNGVSDYSIIHNIKIHIRFKHRCLMSKPCLSTIYDTFLYNMILTNI